MMQLDDELNVLPISTTAQELAELSPSKTFIPPVPPVAVLPTRDDTKGWTHDFRRTLEALGNDPLVSCTQPKPRISKSC